MTVSVIAIGNSKGIRLPKTILNQLHIADQIDLEVRNNEIILKPIAEAPRSGWEEAFKKMHEQGEDILVMKDSSAEESFEWEWEW